jgi:valyl-tRNA synthetase
VSDLEVEPREHTGSFKWSRGQKDKDGNPVPFNAAALRKVLDRDPSGHMYYIRYPLKPADRGQDPGLSGAAGSSGPGQGSDPAPDFVMVATTRPETMLADTGVAIHPDNPKLKHLIGRACILPLVGREIPIVGDEYADPEKGTGAVKITPAHDFNDWEVGKRAKLAAINVLDAKGTLNDNAPEAYRGLDRFEARKKVVADLHALGALERIEPSTHSVPHAQRGDAIIEPWLTDQWYVDAATLAKPALAALTDGRTRFVPEKYAADYRRWMEGILPWCISRQLWWGHQIPAWYGPDGHVFVAFDETEAKAEAKAHYQTGAALTRDPDVLDTWFSSALWPFSTLGWPEETPELARYYPTSCLVTGFDIIFFWVARMMMTGVHFMPDVPFRDVYIHGLVRDEKGRKMSKSIGNVIDPLLLIDKYGADALRFTLAALTTQGRDVKLSDARVEGYRNFATKLWNAARFAEMNECRRVAGFDPRSAKETINRWIAGETERAGAAVTAAIEAYKFNEAAGAIYEFVWGTVCDWYLELAKPILAPAAGPSARGPEGMGQSKAQEETRAMTAWVIDQALALLHPFMPFITEELWAKSGEQGPKRDALLALSQWPRLTGLADPAADAEIGWLIKLISDVRSVRSEMNVPAAAKIPLVLSGAGAETRVRAARHSDTILRLARLERVTFEGAPPTGSAQIVVGEATVALPLAGVIDMAAERKRLEKAIAGVRSDMGKMDAKLTNPSFMARAAPEAIEEAQERKAELVGQLAKLEAAAQRVAGAG